MTPNWNALAKSIISYLWVSYYTFVFSLQCKTMLFTNKKHAVTSSERAHSITWYTQKRRRNRWASKQVSRRWCYINGRSINHPFFLLRNEVCTHESYVHWITNSKENTPAYKLWWQLRLWKGTSVNRRIAFYYKSFT